MSEALNKDSHECIIYVEEKTVSGKATSNQRSLQSKRFEKEAPEVTESSSEKFEFKLFDINQAVLN